MGSAVVVLKVEERNGRMYVTLWYRGRKIRKKTAVRIDFRSDGAVKDSSIRAVRNLLEHAPVGYLSKRLGGGYVAYLVAENDEAVRAALEKAVAEGSARLGVRVKMLKASMEEWMLSRELWRRRIKHLRNVYFEGYNVDFLIPEYRIVVEIDGLQHYQERVQAKDLEKLNILKKKGYEVFRIQASDVRRDPASIAEMIRGACVRRMENRQKP